MRREAERRNGRGKEEEKHMGKDRGGKIEQGEKKDKDIETEIKPEDRA